MAQSADVPRRASRPLPTLEDSYASLMANSARIVRLIDQHMAVGHLLETPWEEARTLHNTTNLFSTFYGDPSQIRGGSRTSENGLP